MTAPLIINANNARSDYIVAQADKFVWLPDDVKVLSPSDNAASYKHGKHDQRSHGRKGRAGRAGAAAYQAARSGGASHSQALAASREATTAERAAERAERAAKRTDRLQSQAERARRAANSDQVTPAQRAKLLDKADRLEARARGETVGKPAASPIPRKVRTDEEAKAELRRLEGEVKAIDREIGAARGAGTLTPAREAQLRADRERAYQRSREYRSTLTTYDNRPIESLSMDEAKAELKRANADEKFTKGIAGGPFAYSSTATSDRNALSNYEEVRAHRLNLQDHVAQMERDQGIVPPLGGRRARDLEGWRQRASDLDGEIAAQRAAQQRAATPDVRALAVRREQEAIARQARYRQYADDLDRRLLPEERIATATKTLGALLIRFKHGKHDQRSHGRKGPRGRAASAAYSAARAGGASHTEARAAANDVSRSVAIRQRYANINKQLEGHLSERQRSSLLAEQKRLNSEQGRIMERMSAAQRTEAMSADVAPSVRGRAAPAPRKPAKADGDPTRAYGADPNQSYQLQHRVVDMADLKASNLANGAINPAYDPKLQPRDRSRAASQAQIDQVARNLNPDVLVTDFHRIDAGSPIIDANGNVLSGNGRTLALQRAADMNPAQFAAYKARLKDEAERLGIDPKAIEGMKNPVLVRELKGDADPVAFAREANSSGTLRMSPLEQAKVDAGLVSDRSLLKLNVAEGQGIDQALRSPANKAFINDFLATVPDNERANLLTRNGELNQMGLYRAKAALYTKAFPGEAGSRLAESMLESLDPDVKTVQNGISASLPNISRATALMRNGDRDSALDLSEDFARTIDVYARIKDNPALTANTPANQLVSKYLGQSQLFDRELTPDQEVLLRHIDTISRRPSAVRDMFNNWATIVENQPPPGQSSLFGDTGGMTKRELIDALIRGDTGGASQAGMFDG